MSNVRRNPPKGFPERMTKCIEDNNTNCVQLAKVLGVDRKRLYDYKNGVSVPDITIFAKMCKAFNVTADYLLFGGRWSS